MTTKAAGSTPSVRELSNQIAELQHAVEQMQRAPRLANASIEGVPLTVNDEEGQQRQTIGLQPDGTYTTVDVNGPPPPVPNPPAVEVRAGTLVVTWDGTFVGGATAPADWDHVELHVYTEAGYIPTDATQVATYNTLKGGSVTLALDAVPQYIKLQAVNTSRVESEPSVEVSATPLPPATGAGGVKTYYEDSEPIGLGADDDGSLWYDTNDGNHPYRWNGTTLAWISIQDAAIANAQSTADDALAAATTDGLAPAASPDPMALSGIGSFIIRWSAITNADPVRYQVHVSPTLGFTATVDNPATMVGETSGTQFTVRALPGPEPAPGDPDPRALEYGTTYYVRIIALDDDGSAPQSLQVPAQVFQVTGLDLAYDSVTAANIVAGTLTGELFAATVILAGTFKTADAGQRVEVGIAGIQGYKSDGSLMLNFPTDPDQTALIDAEIIARGLTVTNGATFRSASFIEPDGTLTLQRSTAAPVSAPQMQQQYTTVQPSTATLTAAEKTGALGTFDLISTEVSFIEWKPGSPGYWRFYQIRPNGTRAWNLNADGTPRTTTSYFTDFPNYEIWSAVEITTSTSAKNGYYYMARFIPDGALNTYYLLCPQGLMLRNRYSRQNGATPPVIGSNGTDVYIAEIINSDELNIRYFTPNGDGNNISAPTVAYQSTTGFVDNAPLSTVLYDANGFDVSAGTGLRYLTGYRGLNYNNKILNALGTNANSLFPSGSGNSWAAASKDAHSFEVPTVPRGIAWDGTNFWTYGADGLLYQHTNNFWDPNSVSQTVWSEYTFYDSDAGGTGNHESTPGPSKSFFWKRRSNIQYLLPPIPDKGGVDDPDQIRIYVGRGATLPANAAMWRQVSASGSSVILGAVTLAGSNPPTVNNFPGANPGKIRNDDDTMVLSGDGSFKAVSVVAPTIRVGTTLGTGDNVAIDGPYYYAWISSQATVASGSITTLTGYTSEGAPNNSGITLAAGIFTLPRAGRYRVKGQLYWAPLASPAGSRLLQCTQVSPALTVVSDTDTPSASIDVVNQIDKEFRFAANAQIFFRFRHTQGAPIGPSVASQDLSWVQITWVGA